MIIWEYKTATINPALPFTNESTFNSFGAYGWELVCVNDVTGVAYFKRQKPISENKND